MAARELRTVNVHLDKGGIRFFKVTLERHIGPQRDNGVGLLQNLYPGLGSDSARRTHVSRCVIGHDTLGNRCGHDRRVEFIRQSNNVLAGTLGPFPDVDQRPFGGIQQLSRFRNLIGIRFRQNCLLISKGRADIVIFNRCPAQILRNGHHSDTVMANCLPNGFINDGRQLLRCHGRPVVYRNVRKHRVLVHFLEVAGVHHAGRHLTNQGQNRHVVILSIVQPIQQVHRTRTGRAEGSSDLPRDFRLSGSRQSPNFFMANLNVMHSILQIIQGVHGGVEGTTRQSVNGIDPPIEQYLDHCI